MTDTAVSEKDAVLANRAAWNEVASIHFRAKGDKRLEAVRKPDFSTFDKVEQELFSGIGLTNKSVAQLACNNAQELISVKKAGAARCVGFDLSDAFIAQGRQ